MRLNEYIELTGIPVTRLADRCGLTWHQLNHILKGKEPKLRNAITISDYTKNNPLIVDGKKEWVKPCEMVSLELAQQDEDKID